MNGEQLIDAANEYKVTVDYLLMMDSPDEGYEQEDELMQLFSKLNDTGRSKLIDYADDLVSSGKYGEKEVCDSQVSGYKEVLSA